MKTLNGDAARLVGVHPGSANAIKAKQAEIANVWTNLKGKVCLFITNWINSRCMIV